MVNYPETYASSSPVGTWVPDPLGPGFWSQTLPLGSDEEGPVVATLVKYVPEQLVARKPPVLYIHGWSDYFFNAEFAQFWADRGHPFFALDLRKYGRSLRKWQSPGLIKDLVQYDTDILAARRVIADELNVPKTELAPVMCGHSTGGLVVALWASRFPKKASALVLNSPWLEFQASALMRQVTAALVTPSSTINPVRELKLPLKDQYYRTISRDFDGEWELHPTWRPPASFPVFAVWLTAVLAGQAQVAKGLDLPMPVWVGLSDRSNPWSAKEPEAKNVDIVIDVEQVAARVHKLGTEVTLYRQANGMHDLFASAPEVRSETYAALTRWLKGYVDG